MSAVVAIKSRDDVRKLVAADMWMMKVLKVAEDLDLPDWWIGAGFLRNKVWDAIEGNDSSPSKDVDLVYFNAGDKRPETDWAHDKRLRRDFPFAKWEVRNQARMHYKNGFEPFGSTEDGISHWVETATCVAVKLVKGELKFLFCHGTDDLFGLVARPSPCTKGSELMKLFYERIEKKQWRQRWPHLQVNESQVS